MPEWTVDFCTMPGAVEDEDAVIALLVALETAEVPLDPAMSFEVAAGIAHSTFQVEAATQVDAAVSAIGAWSDAQRAAGFEHPSTGGFIILPCQDSPQAPRP